MLCVTLWDIFQFCISNGVFRCFYAEAVVIIPLIPSGLVCRYKMCLSQFCHHISSECHILVSRYQIRLSQFCHHISSECHILVSRYKMRLSQVGNHISPECHILVSRYKMCLSQVCHHISLECCILVSRYKMFLSQVGNQASSSFHTTAIHVGFRFIWIRSWYIVENRKAR